MKALVRMGWVPNWRASKLRYHHDIPGIDEIPKSGNSDVLYSLVADIVFGRSIRFVTIMHWLFLLKQRYDSFIPWPFLRGITFLGRKNVSHFWQRHIKIQMTINNADCRRFFDAPEKSFRIWPIPRRLLVSQMKPIELEGSYCHASIEIGQKDGAILNQNTVLPRFLIGIHTRQIGQVSSSCSPCFSTINCRPYQCMKSCASTYVVLLI